VPTWLIVVIVIVVALVVVIGALGAPDLNRYMRMRRM
jgi:Family of unknown function (DUF6893)